MAILAQMTDALAVTAVKYAGGEKPIPELEFVMHPNKRKDAMLEKRLHDSHLVFHEATGDWTFRGVPIREDAEQSSWTLAPAST